MNLLLLLLGARSTLSRWCIILNLDANTWLLVAQSLTAREIFALARTCKAPFFGTYFGGDRAQPRRARSPTSLVCLTASELYCKRRPVMSEAGLMRHASSPSTVRDRVRCALLRPS